MTRKDFWLWLGGTEKSELSVAKSCGVWCVFCNSLRKRSCDGSSLWIEVSLSDHRTRATAEAHMAKYRRWLKQWEQRDAT